MRKNLPLTEFSARDHALRDDAQEALVVRIVDEVILLEVDRIAVKIFAGTEIGRP